MNNDLYPVGRAAQEVQKVVPCPECNPVAVMDGDLDHLDARLSSITLEVVRDETGAQWEGTCPTCGYEWAEDYWSEVSVDWATAAPNIKMRGNSFTTTGRIGNGVYTHTSTGNNGNVYKNW